MTQPPRPSKNIAVYLSGPQQDAVDEVAAELHLKTGTTVRHLALIGLELERKRLGLDRPKRVVDENSPLAERILADPTRAAKFPGRPRVTRESLEPTPDLRDQIHTVNAEAARVAAATGLPPFSPFGPAAAAGE